MMLKRLTVITCLFLAAAFTVAELTTANDASQPTPDQKPPTPQQSFSMDARDVPVLMYHHLDEHPNTSGAITPEQFEAQLQWLDQMGYRSINPDQLVDSIESGDTFSRPKVLMTFDDGYRSTLTHALPLLETYGFEATLFIYTERIQDTPGHLSADELLVMQSRGITIASHAVSHADLPALLTKEGLPAVQHELNHSREILESLMKTEVTHLAFPYGAYCPDVINAARDAGFNGLFAITRNRDCQDDTIVQRIPVLRETTLDEFRTLLSPSGKTGS